MAGRFETFGAVEAGEEFKAQGRLFTSVAQGDGTSLDGTCKLQMFMPGNEVWVDLKTYTGAGFEVIDLGDSLKRLRWNQTVWTAGSFKASAV